MNKKEKEQLAKYSAAGMKNLQDHMGKIVEFAWIMKKNNLEDVTIKDRVVCLKHLAKLGARLLNTESVETVLATEINTAPAKYSHVKAYLAFTIAFQIPWTPPKTKYQPPVPFIPLQAEIDQLIDECTHFGGVFIQLLQDCGARSGEAIKTKWTDLDVTRRTITINNPEKGSLARTIKIKEKTVLRLCSLPRCYGEYIFNPNSVSLQQGINRAKRRLAAKTGNPRFLKIHLHTLRHFSGTMEFARTKDILKTQKKLGHKSITSTAIYTHLIEFAESDYEVKRPKTTADEDALIKEGFEFVRFDERDHCPIYRKRM